MRGARLIVVAIGTAAAVGYETVGHRHMADALDQL